MQLFGFTIEIYYDARPYERQIVHPMRTYWTLLNHKHSTFKKKILPMKYGRFRQDIRTVSLKMQCLSPELKSAQNGQSGSSNTSRPCSNRSAVSGPVFAKYIFSPTCHPLSTCGPQNCSCWSQEISAVLNSSTAEHMLFFIFLFSPVFLLLQWMFIKTFHCPHISHVHTLQIYHWKCLHKLGSQITTFLSNSENTVNRLTPNDPYMGRTAPLTSKCCILYIYSTNIGTE